MLNVPIFYQRNMLRLINSIKKYITSMKYYNNNCCHDRTNNLCIYELKKVILLLRPLKTSFCCSHILKRSLRSTVWVWNLWYVVTTLKTSCSTYASIEQIISLHLKRQTIYSIFKKLSAFLLANMNSNL